MLRRVDAVGGAIWVSVAGIWATHQVALRITGVGQRDFAEEVVFCLLRPLFGREGELGQGTGARI